MNRCTVRVLLTPAEFEKLTPPDLAEATVVVFDVLRATSSMITALGHGALAIRPVASIEAALAARQREPDLLLAGERHGERITAELTGGVEFDFGNSPREFIRERVEGRRLVMTTTNGTRALSSARGALRILVGSFLNLSATLAWLNQSDPGRVLLIGSGTFEEAALEDTLAVGAVVEGLSRSKQVTQDDSATIAQQLYQLHRGDLLSAVALARNGRRLLDHPELAPDVAFALSPDRWSFAAELRKDGWVHRATQA